MEFFAAVKNNVAGTLKNTIDKSKWNSKIYSSREYILYKKKTKNRKQKTEKIKVRLKPLHTNTFN